MKKKIDPNYFFVHRVLLNSDRWLNEPFTRGQAWVDMFGLAQHAKGFFRIRGIKISVERGQLAYSKLTLSKRWKWSRGKVNRFLSELEKQNDITLKTVQQNGQQIKYLTTLITIIKYNMWQGDDTAKRTPDGHQTDTKQDIYKNIKNEKKNIVQDTKDVFSLKETLNKLKESKRRIDNIIALYISYRGITFDNKQQFNTHFPRYLKEAKQLEGYKDKQILNAMDYCEDQARGRYEWKLSTVVKSIDLC